MLKYRDPEGRARSLRILRAMTSELIFQVRVVAMRLRVAAAAILIVALVVPVTAQQYPSPPFYQLLPSDYPYPLIRVCSTQWGICAIPVSIQPGAPCSCLAAYGAWLPGVCVR